jgi:threonine dehydratase
MKRPTLHDVLEARKTISPYLSRTPLHYYAALSRFLDAEVRLKHENHHALGAFKVRGGVNLLAHMSEEDRSRGVITASSGNHGQSVAYACKLFGARAIIGLPQGANPLKAQSMRDLGAELIFHGKHFDEAREHCERLAKEEGYRYVHPVNEPLIIAGVATESLEIIEDFPDVDYIFAPMGGGTGAAGACIVAKAANPDIKVIAVQSAQAPAGYLSWKKGEITDAPMETIAEGMATATAYELTQGILRDLLDDFLLVDDGEIDRAIAMLIEKAHTLAEGAGAAPLAGAIKYREQIKGKKVALIITGGNITLGRLREVLDAYQLA